MTESAAANLAAPPTAPTPRTSGADLVKLLALAVGFVMATLDATVVNVAGATIGARLDLSLSSLTWVVDGYVLSFAALLLLSGSLADRFGAKRLYGVGMAVFTTASLACAAAGSGPVLVAARLVQGAGAALFMPASLALLMAAFPQPARRTRMLGVWTAIVSTASGLGPVVGGVLVGAWGWRSIFWLNLPLGVVGLLLTWRLVRGSRPAGASIAPLGRLLGIGMLALLCFGLIEGPERGWGSPLIIGALAACAGCAVLFVLRERSGAVQVLPRALFARAEFSAANVIGFLLNVGLFGGSFMLGLFLQQGRGASVAVAGWQLLPMMIVILVGNLLFARISGRAGIRRPLVVSLTVAAAGALVLALWPALPYWGLAVLMAVVNFSIGIVVPAMTAAVMNAADGANASVASATLNANRQVGALVGIAVMGVLLDTTADWYRGAALCFAAMGASYLLAALLAWRFVRPAQAGPAH